mgnify:CR=1 FL=1
MSLSITDVNQLMRRRRTIKPITKTGEPNYRDEPLDEALIQNLLENANWAPTHGLTEPWRFQVFQEQAREPLARFLSELYEKHTEPDQFRPQKQQKLVSYVLHSPCTISLGMKRHEGNIPAEEEVIAVACAVQNMHLTATALGLGAFWSSSPVYDLPATRQCVGWTGETCVVTVAMQQYGRPGLLIDPEELLLDPGKSGEIVFKVQNRGNDKDTITLDVVNRSGLEQFGVQFSFSGSSFELNPDATADVTLTVTTTKEVGGGIFEVEITATSQHSADEVDTWTINAVFRLETVANQALIRSLAGALGEASLA